MKVVITGGTGFLGAALAHRLLERGTLTAPSGGEETIEAILLFDAAAPPELSGLDDGRVEVRTGDVADRETVRGLVDRDDVSVFHLASIVSAGGERDFDGALRVNLDGGRNVFEACRAREGRPRVVFASSFAAYGGSALPETVTDTTKLTPQTTYGMTKATCELLLNDYTRKGFLDGRAARLPTVIIRPGKPNPAASAWASGIFREPLAGQECILPVDLETRTPVSGHRTVVENLIRLHEAGGEALGDDRGLNFPSLSASAAEMQASLGRVASDRTLGPITVRPDPATEAIVNGWARYGSSERADRLGFARDADLDSIVRAYIEDFLPR